jgi:hypothetical protein
MDFETEDMLNSIKNLSYKEQEEFRSWVNRTNWKLYKKYKKRAQARNEGVKDED